MRVAWFGVLVVLVVLAFSEVFVNSKMDEVVEWIPVSVFSKAAAPERTEMQWYRIRAAIAQAIEPFPEAYEAVVRALKELSEDW